MGNINRKVSEVTTQASADQPISYITTRDLTPRNVRKTIKAWRLAASHAPALIQKLDDLAAVALERREALAAEAKVKRAYAELAGIEVADRQGMTRVGSGSDVGRRGVDQAWLTSDGSTLVIHDCMDPTDLPRLKQVPDADGTFITAKQGSTAYAYQMLREDTALRAAILGRTGVIGTEILTPSTNPFTIQDGAFAGKLCAFSIVKHARLV